MSVLKKKRIEGGSFYLRPITIEDTDDIIRWRNSETVRPYFIYQMPFTREGHLNWLKTMIDTRRGYQFIACERQTGRPIGCTYLRDLVEEHSKAEIGIFIGEKDWIGKGLGSEMIKLTVRFAFEDLGLHKVFCRILSGNMPSIKCFERSGFEREAYLKKEVFVNHQYRDVIFMAVLNPAEVYPLQEGIK